MDQANVVLMITISSLILFFSVVLVKYYWKFKETSIAYTEAKNIVKDLLWGVKQNINEQNNDISAIRNEVSFFQARNDFLSKEKIIDEKKLELLSQGVETALVATNKFGNVVISMKQSCEKVELNQNSIERQIREINAKQKELEESRLPQKTETQVATTPFNIEKKEVRKGLEKLNSTEIQVLSLLNMKSMPAPEIGRNIGKTREHSARLMKKLYEEGYIERDTNKMPYSYKINENLRNVLEEVKGNVS
jgi:hypothetical protein